MPETTRLSLPLTPAPAILDDREFRSTLQRATWALALSLGLPLLVLLGLVLALLRSAQWVDHSDRVLAETHRVQSMLLSMQTSFRGYRLADEESYLDLVARTRQSLGPVLEKLAVLVVDNAEQKENVATLRSRIDTWTAFVDAEVARVRGQPALVRDASFLKQGVPIFEATTAVLKSVFEQEEKLRGERDRRLKQALAALLGTLGVVALVGIPWLTRWLQRLLREVSKSYRTGIEAAELRARELAVTLRSIGDAVVATDAEGRVEFLNPVAEELMGWTSVEARGRVLTEVFVIFNEHTRQTVENPVDRVLRENRVVGLANHTVLRARNGKEVPIEDSAAPIRDEKGEVFGVILVFHDVTEKRLTEVAERAAAESGERFRLLAEVISLQVWTARPDGELDYANAECSNYFGANIQRDILGVGWTQFVHPEDLPRAATAWQASIASGERYEVEFRLRNAAGEYRWFLVRAAAMQDSAGQTAKWFGTNTDVDELKAAQSEADRASRAKDNFLAVLSHELRTPLTPVLMTAAALRDDERLPTDVRMQLGMMERNIGLEARLIDDLLDLTRIAKGKLPLRLQLCDAHSLIGLAVEIVRDEAQAKGIVLEQNFTARRSGLLADPSRFQQVIWNLLRNAVKFTPKGGNISIETREVPGETDTPALAIQVRDSGIGIQQEAIDRIFQPFEQAGIAGDHRFGGIGLGLAIARAIVDLHGGSIRAESEGPGRGSTFLVVLPGATEPPWGMVDPAEGSDPFLHGTQAAPRETPQLLPLNLLLVEDHEPTLQVLTRLLTRAGHHVVSASTVAGALAIASEGKFDLVISDLGLPDGTGNALMERLKERYQLRGIALTGYGMEEDVERSRQSGFITHLIKPVDFNQLRRVLVTFQSGEESGGA